MNFNDILTCDDPEILSSLKDEDILAILEPILKDCPPIETKELDKKAEELYIKDQEKKKELRRAKLRDKINLGQGNTIRIPKDPIKRAMLEEDLKLIAKDI